MSCPGRVRTGQRQEIRKSRPGLLRPGLLLYGRGGPVPAGVRNLPSGAPPSLLRPAGAAPPQSCPQPIRCRGNSGFRLVPSYHNRAQGLRLQGKRTASGGRFQKTVGFGFAFSQEGEIQPEEAAGNCGLCDVSPAHRALFAASILPAGAFPDRAVRDPRRKTGMKQALSVRTGPVFTLRC